MAVVLAALPLDASVGASQSASTVVSAEVLSATNISIDPTDPPTAGSCLTGTPDVTDFGPLMPGTSNVTGTECSVVFGSSNDTSMLRVYQSDQIGDAMYTGSIGSLDQSFDGPPGEPNHPGNGIVWLDSDASQDDRFMDVAGQPDGKIVAVGRNDQAGNDEAYIVRLNADGTWDTTFNGTGWHTLPATGGDSQFNAVAIQPDGYIVAVGYRWNGADHDYLVARFEPDGDLDPDFDGDGPPADGLIMLDPNGAGGGAAGVALQDDGKIVTVGDLSQGGMQRPSIVRMNPDGTLDADFDGPALNGDGIVDMNHSNGEESYADVAIQDDGKIVAIGFASNPNQRFRMTRLLPDDGALDPAFDGPVGGAGGDMIANLPAAWLQSYGSAVDIDSQGRIVFAGRSREDATDYDHIVGRLLPADGSLDPTFDGDASLENYPGNGIIGWNSGGTPSLDETFDVAALPTGQVMFAGRSRFGCDDVAVGRLNADGSLDATFDGDSGTANGVVVLDLDPIGSGGCHQYVHALELLDDGRVILAGHENFFRHPLLIMLGGMSVDDFDSDGPNDIDGDGDDLDWSTAGAAFFGACMVDYVNGAHDGTTWQPDLFAAADCLDGDDDPWNAVPATSTKILESDASGQTAAQANLLFGFRTAIDQPPGSYAASITFEAVAPNV